MTDDDVRASSRDLVRRGYDQISRRYRSDDGRANPTSAETTAMYEGWVDELAALLPASARVLDLGCGAGVPTSFALVERGFRVTGLDISQVQVDRARELVPKATFVLADMASWDAPAGSFDAVVSLYALIHVPLLDQQALFPRVHNWLAPGGYLLVIVGAQRWSGIESYLGAEMFWDHADAPTYLRWFRECGLEPIWDRFIREGTSGHTLVLARAL